MFIHPSSDMGSAPLIDLIIFLRAATVMHTLLHGLPHRLSSFSFGPFKDTDSVAGRKDRLNTNSCPPRQNTEEGAFPDPFTKDANLRSVKIGDRYLLDRFLVVIFAYPDHGVNDLVRFIAHLVFSSFL
jgi:hypothetical protein